MKTMLLQKYIMGHVKVVNIYIKYYYIILLLLLLTLTFPILVPLNVNFN